jgi:hypothetical protein
MADSAPGMNATTATLEDVADALVQRLQSLMPAGGLYGRAALARLPGPVEHLLAAVLERRVAREAAIPESEWFDLDDAKVREAARQWREAAGEAARYPEDAWPEALAEATRQALRHLVEPAETAAAFCFEGESGAIPVATVRARMTAFGPYPYLIDIAERYAERKGMDRIDRGGLVSLLRRIDRRMTGTYGPAEWSALTAPLFTLVGPLPGLDGRLPAEVLRRFFVARGADSLAEAVTSRPAWTAVELHDAVAGVLAPTGRAFERPVEEPPAAAGNETIVVDAAADEYEAEADVRTGAAQFETIHEVLAQNVVAAPDAVGALQVVPDPEPPAYTDDAPQPPADTDDATPRPAEAAGARHVVPPVEPDEGKSRPAVETPPGPDDTIGDDALFSAFGAAAAMPAAMPAPDVPPPASSDEHEPLWQRLARTHAGSADPLSRLEARVLGDDAIAQRTWFVAEIAGGSEAYYRRLLEGLDAAGSWSDAWPVLAEAFKANDVDLYSEAAIAITDAAEARFRG